MRAVIQRVSSAQVAVANHPISRIERGLLIFLGVAAGDTLADAEWLAQKIATLRIFSDDEGRMNRSVIDLAGELLVVSQFTLIASTRKGTRPSFNHAAPPDQAIPLYAGFIGELEGHLGRPVSVGRFGAEMAVQLVNDGPVTLIIDTARRE